MNFIKKSERTQNSSHELLRRNPIATYESCCWKAIPEPVKMGHLGVLGSPQLVINRLGQPARVEEKPGHPAPNEANHAEPPRFRRNPARSLHRRFPRTIPDRHCRRTPGAPNEANREATGHRP